MSDLKARLDQIDALAGREPGPDPAKIMGAPGPNLPEDPPIRARAPGPIPEPEWLNGDEEVPVPDSPLAPRFAPVAPTPPVIPTPDLAVVILGDQRPASLKGREVILTESEAAKVTRVVISALRRSLRDQERELAGLLPKRQKKVGKGRSAKDRA